MNFDAKIHPLKIEFYDWYLVHIPEIKHTVIIDTLECELTTKKHITGTHMVNIQSWSLEEQDIERIIGILNINNVTKYTKMSDSQKTNNGYRDGWRLYYRLIFKDRPSITGMLGDLYIESPYEQVLIFLSKTYPSIHLFS
jgi:hypothetical protein